MLEGLRKNISLAEYSTIRIGGPARYLVKIDSPDQIKPAVDWAAENNHQYFVLGDGSNTLFDDSGYSGLVLHNQILGYEWTESGDKVRVKVGSGENWDSLVEACIDRGLSGIEAMSGIPGQVGSTPIQNVGAYGQEVSRHIESVEAICLKTFKPKVFTADECGFGYRTSRFKTSDKNSYYVTSVNFAFTKKTEPKILYQELFHYVKQNLRYKEIKTIPGQLAAIRKAVLAIRATKSMVVSAGDLNSHSLGSFFVNPIVDKDQLQAVHDTLTAEQKETFRAHKAAGRYKLSAAWLIERSGFSKGFKHKSAMLSKNHCLALCNPGKASSNDVKELSGMIQAAVKDKWGIELEPEPGFVAP